MAHSLWDSNPRPSDYILSALREWDIFQLIMRDIGSGDIDIFFVKVNNEIPTSHGKQ